MKELLKAIGLEEDADVEAAVKHFQENFVPNLRLKEKNEELEGYRKRLGSSMDAVDAVVKRHAKSLLGEDLGGIEIKEGMKTSELVEQVLSKVDDKVAELHKTDPESKKLIEDWQKKFSNLEGKFQLKDQELLEAHKQLEVSSKEKSEQLVGIELKYAKDKFYAGAKWSKTADDFSKRGFNAAMDEKFEFTMNEGLLQMKNKATGEIPKNAAETAYLTPDEILQSEMQTAKLWQENDINEEKKPWERTKEKDGDTKTWKKPERIESPELG